MGAIPAELVQAVQAAGGGVGVMLLFAAAALYRHFTARDRERQGLIDRGFADLGEVRAREIQRLTQALDEERQRRSEDMERKRRIILELEADRDEGWDRARAMETIAHERRHQGNEGMMAAYQAGKIGAPMPPPLPPVPPLHEVERRPPHLPR